MPSQSVYGLALGDDVLSVVVSSLYFVLTILALLYGVTSWCLIKKFRNYRNYVFLNTILANLVFISNAYWRGYANRHRNDELKKEEIKEVDDGLIKCILFFSVTVKNVWLLIISHMFYVDFVKVFNGHIKRKYLVSSLCGWGVPFILITGFYFYDNWAMLTNDDSGMKIFLIITYIHIALSFYLPLIVNCIFYIIIVSSVCCSSNPTGHRTANKCRRFYIATLIFILSDVSFFASWSMDHITLTNPSLHGLFDTLVIFLNPLILDIFLVVVKSNRVLWHTFLAKQLRRHRDCNISMNEGITRESAASHPPVADI